MLPAAAGAPGLGPLSLRREPGGVVFKESYRSRSYCLSECANVCSITVNRQTGSGAGSGGAGSVGGAPN